MIAFNMRQKSPSETQPSSETEEEIHKPTLTNNKLKMELCRNYL